MKSKTLYATAAEARERGFWRLTNAYHLPQDEWMLTAAVNQLGNISCVLVPFDGGVTIWRAGRKLDDGGEVENDG